MNFILKKKLGVIVISLFFLSALNVNGGIIKNKTNFLTEIGKINNERSIVVPDSDIIIRLWEENVDNGNTLQYYSISLDGGNTTVRTVQAYYEIGLRYAHFDPISEEPTTEPSLKAGDDIHLFIVQFYTQPLEEFKNAIKSLGGSVYQYIAQYAYLVKMNETVKNQVEKLPYVRWIGPYHPAYRLEEFIIDNYKNADEMYPLLRYNIQVHTVEHKDILVDRINNIGGIVDSSNFGKKLISATLTPEQLFIVSRYDEVNFIDRWSEYEADMDIGREIGGANYIETIAGFTGNDVRGESFDTGFNLNHVDFQNNPLIVHGPPCGGDYHGTACIGICFGDGTGNEDARGLLPDGQGIVADYSVIGLIGQSRYDHSGELVQEPYNAVFQTASVGSDRTTQYTTISADSDQAIFDFDLVHCQSQSNAGSQMSRPQAWAKNMISGGGINHYDTLDKSDDCWCYGASIGPATDGRIKPTFVFFYDDILTVGYPGNNDYTSTFGGTSGATPMIAGHVGLFFQMWDEGVFGNNVNLNGSVFENKAHFTTAKAMLINTAEQYEFSGTDHDKTRMHQGWGMPNLKNMYDLRENVYVIDETDVLKPFEKGLHKVFVESETPALKVTITYADTPGNPAVQTQHRINDLTLKVISPSETIFWGNKGLLEGIWSEPGGSPDTKNTVECVYIENPEPGAWIIEISADEIIEDTHLETSELDADYALVISPVLSGPNTPEFYGPTEGDIGNEYEFTFITIDPENMDIYYFVDWDDGTYTEWTGPYPSGKKVNVSHTWLEKGNHSIKVKAKNTFGVESSWSEPHIINIFAPELKIDLVTGGFWKINIIISNIGRVEATNVSWNLSIEGGYIFMGRKTSMIIPSIPAGQQVKVKSNIIIGFGETKFNVNTIEPYGSLDFLKRGGKIFGIYIRVNQGGD
ncbi:hypothetical protein AYK24_10805 [Thermoplasmatales archaeon SG8-52-4]|nr:MAG: hypothetical protein AYK24_10805 [Thermoplasmatales archaeon SG8-52-4]